MPKFFNVKIVTFKIITLFKRKDQLNAQNDKLEYPSSGMI